MPYPQELSVRQEYGEIQMQQGIKVQICLAVSGKGEPLGLLSQPGWVREHRSGKREPWRKWPADLCLTDGLRERGRVEANAEPHVIIQQRPKF